LFSDTIKSVRHHNLLCKQCVFVAAYAICSKYGRYCMEIQILYRGRIEYTQR